MGAASGDDSHNQRAYHTGGSVQTPPHLPKPAKQKKQSEKHMHLPYSPEVSQMTYRMVHTRITSQTPPRSNSKSVCWRNALYLQVSYLCTCDRPSHVIISKGRLTAVAHILNVIPAALVLDCR